MRLPAAYRRPRALSPGGSHPCQPRSRRHRPGEPAAAPVGAAMRLPAAYRRAARPQPGRPEPLPATFTAAPPQRTSSRSRRRAPPRRQLPANPGRRAPGPTHRHCPGNRPHEWGATPHQPPASPTLPARHRSQLGRVHGSTARQPATAPAGGAAPHRPASGKPPPALTQPSRHDGVTRCRWGRRRVEVWSLLVCGRVGDGRGVRASLDELPFGASPHRGSAPRTPPASRYRCRCAGTSSTGTRVCSPEVMSRTVTSPASCSAGP